MSLSSTVWGNGYRYESLNHIIEFAKNNMKVQEINACIYIENSRSIALAEKLGFVLTGSKYELFRGKKYLHSIYSLNLK